MVVIPLKYIFKIIIIKNKKGEILSYKSKETISLESQLKDFIDVRLGNKTKSDIMRKYGISSSTYKKYKQRFVFEYGEFNYYI